MSAVAETPVHESIASEGEQRGSGCFCGVRPRKDNIMCRRVDGPETKLPAYRPDLVIVPEQYRQKSPWAVVFAVGPDVSDVAVCDVILMQVWGGVELNIAGHEFIILRREHVLAKIED